MNEWTQKHEIKATNITEQNENYDLVKHHYQKTSNSPFMFKHKKNIFVITKTIFTQLNFYQAYDSVVKKTIQRQLMTKISTEFKHLQSDILVQ